MNELRVRFAPSPTGIPHIGNIRSALFNYLFAKHHNGKFILRIEDTDRTRFVLEAEKAIEDTLIWLGLDWDEKFVQSQRLNIYKEHAEILKKKNSVYEDNGALRFKMPKTGETEWQDAVGRKKIVFKNQTQEDFIIIKSDGFPTYNFANVIDDHLMGITHVIRGDEFISSTPKHIQLYNSFEWAPPVFAHLPVILGPDGGKLSKRHGAEPVLNYREKGYVKEAILNFMALLGWNPGEDREILSMIQMIDLFDLKDVNTNSPVFDSNKLNWFNSYYIRSAPVEVLLAELKHIKLSKEVTEDFMELARTRIKNLNEFYDLLKPFSENLEIDLAEREKEIAKELLNSFSSVKEWEKGKILESLMAVSKKTGEKMPIFYKIITGKTTGLPLPESLQIFGKQKTLERIESALK